MGRMNLIHSNRLMPLYGIGRDYKPESVEVSQ
jgi:hypothetical protein